ncbi:MAG: hypothetical protein HY645_12190 [Acidobacteria bacterium]|nr:hypothetical protein [Acidobacteriota bacterium]
MASRSVSPVFTEIREVAIAARVEEKEPSLSLAQAQKKITYCLLIGSALLFTAGVLLNPARAGLNLLLISYYLIGTGLAGAVFIAIQYVSGARWCISLRRIPEAMTAAIPLGAVGLALLFVFRPFRYPWIEEELQGFKGFWLDWPFFLVRAALYVALWILFSWKIVGNSRLQDGDGAWAHTRRNVRFSAGFLVIFAVTFFLASTDWIMSLEPEWYSTIFGMYHFSGLFLSGLATISLIAVWLKQRGTLDQYVSDAQLHDLGKLLFSFSTFWMYIWFSQYMLIWYANIPEETIYFIHRLEGSWGSLLVLNLLLNWGIPFAVLLPRLTKRTPALLGLICVVILVGRWLDLYLMIFPPFAPRLPWFGLWEVAAIALAASIFIVVFVRAFQKASPVPFWDPLLPQPHAHEQHPRWRRSPGPAPWRTWLSSRERTSTVRRGGGR